MLVSSTTYFPPLLPTFHFYCLQILSASLFLFFSPQITNFSKNYQDFLNNCESQNKTPVKITGLEKKTYSENALMLYQCCSCPKATTYLVYAEMLFRIFRDYLRYYADFQFLPTDGQKSEKVLFAQFCCILSGKNQPGLFSVFGFCIKDKICRFCAVGIGRQLAKARTSKQKN